MKKLINLLLIAFISTGFIACEKDIPGTENEEGEEENSSFTISGKVQNTEDLNYFLSKIEDIDEVYVKAEGDGGSYGKSKITNGSFKITLRIPIEKELIKWTDFFPEGFTSSDTELKLDCIYFPEVHYKDSYRGYLELSNKNSTEKYRDIYFRPVGATLVGFFYVDRNSSITGTANYEEEIYIEDDIIHLKASMQMNIDLRKGWNLITHIVKSVMPSGNTITVKVESKRVSEIPKDCTWKFHED